MMRLLTGIGVLIGGSIFNGWVYSILWGWFVVAIFGLPALSIPAAIGVGLLISYFTVDVRNDNPDLMTSLITIFVKGLIYLLVGYVTVGFI